MAKQKLKDIAELESAQAAPPVDEGVVYNPAIYSEEPQEKIESKVHEFDSTLFKLDTAKAIKNTGLYQVEYLADDAEIAKDFDHVDHVHYLRTRDSDGRVPVSASAKPSHPKGMILKSASICGHYHLVEVVPHPTDASKPPVVISVSPPMTIASKKRGSKYITQEQKLNDYDFHTHKIKYLRTDKVKARTKNAEAMKVVAFESMKGQAPKGVIG